MTRAIKLRYLIRPSDRFPLRSGLETVANTRRGAAPVRAEIEETAAHLVAGVAASLVSLEAAKEVRAVV